jgi:ribonuclease HI
MTWKLSQNSQTRELFGSTEPTAAPREKMTAHVDGGARGNPGPSGYGVVFTDADRKVIGRLSQYLGHQTNNFAEYSGLVAALEYALQHGFHALQVYSDSELMVRQLKGIYKVQNPGLRPLYERAKRLIAQLGWFGIEHVRREQNREADRLANLAMDEGTGKTKP